MFRVFIALFALIHAVSLFAQQDVVLYLLGRAVMEDGSPFPDSLRVELVCEGKVIRQAFPNEQGVFSFDLGSVNSTQGVTDAATAPKTGGVDRSFARDGWNPQGFNVVQGRVYLDDCGVRLRPSPGYAASEIKLGIRGVLDKPDIGELLIRRTDSSGDSPVVRAAVPAAADREFQDARRALVQKKPDRSKAARHLQKAVDLYPEYCEAWTLLGEIRLADGKVDAAREAFEKGADADPTALAPRLALGQLALERQDWTSARSRAREILHLDARSPKAHLFLGLASYYLERFPASQWALEQLEEMGQLESFPIAVLHLGMLYAKLGDVPRAAAKLRRYLELAGEPELDADRRQAIERQLKHWEDQGLIAR